jgi:gluconokinase/shikimate kinase
MPVLVIMGVSGSGKSTVAGMLAGRLGWDLAEGDDMHPPANVAKMAAGHPLDDADRWPWLDQIAAWIREHAEAGRPGIITCSALKKSYRDVLRGDHVVFVDLVGTHDQIAARLTARHGHFMPAGMLDSQIETLEPPSAEEDAIRIDVAASSYEASEQIISRLHLMGSAASTQPQESPCTIANDCASTSVATTIPTKRS